METLSDYISLAVLVTTVVSTTLCFVYAAMFRRPAARWLSVTVFGLFWFSLALLTHATSDISQNAFYVGKNVSLISQAIGSVIVVYALPSFLSVAFGVGNRLLLRNVIRVTASVVALLEILRIASAWGFDVFDPFDVNFLLRLILFTSIGIAFVVSFLFHSRLADRNLYRSLLVQIAALVFVFPIVILEDLGIFRIPGFGNLSGQILAVVAAVSAALHAQTSLRRPVYAEQGVPSRYFLERFEISEREADILRGVLEGKSNVAIGEALFISHRTVEKHLQNIYQKTQVKNRIQLINLFRSDS